MYLSDLAVRKAAPRERPYKLADGGGLHVLVRPNGSKSWQMKYRFAGKEKLLSFGTYPMIKLADARERREQAKKLLIDLIDPGEQRKQAKVAAVMTASNTFGVIVAEYLANKQESDAASSTMSKNRWLLEDLAAPLEPTHYTDHGCGNPSALEADRKKRSARNCAPSAGDDRQRVPVRHRDVASDRRPDDCDARRFARA